ncbi:MAG TPA: hypothetical protein V6D05_08875 [Stenomitos sp.]
MFEDYTEVLNQSLRPELRKLALYLKGERADITVKGEGPEWRVVLYENTNFESHALYLWRTTSRESGLRLARHLEGLVSNAPPDDDLEDVVPEFLQAPALRRQTIPDELLPA